MSHSRRIPPRFGLCYFALVLVASACKKGPPPPPVGIPVALPGAEQGTGLDDIRYSASLRKVLVPAGRTGNLDLIDPLTRVVTSTSGFTSASEFGGGHGMGATSVDEGRGLLFVADTGARALSVVDPETGALLCTTPLEAGADFLRYVDLTGEVWVTEPGQQRIEVLALSRKGLPQLAHKDFIPVPGGSESLLIDGARGRAYTLLRHGQVLVMDLRTRAVAAHWPDPCRSPHGLAMDESRGFLFVACTEGVALVLDASRDGKILSQVSRGAGLDVISYSPKLGHLYLAAGASRELVILGVSASGQLSVLGSLPTERDAHCVTADAQGQAWVCSPWSGRVIAIRDPFPPGGAALP